MIAILMSCLMATANPAAVPASDCCIYPNQTADCYLCCPGGNSCCLCCKKVPSSQRPFCWAYCMDHFGIDCSQPPG